VAARRARTVALRGLGPFDLETVIEANVLNKVSAQHALTSLLTATCSRRRTKPMLSDYAAGIRGKKLSTRNECRTFSKLPIVGVIFFSLKMKITCKETK